MLDHLPFAVNAYMNLTTAPAMQQWTPADVTDFTRMVLMFLTIVIAFWLFMRPMNRK